MPFYTPSLTEKIEYDGFMTHITLHSAEKRPLSQETFLLKCPDGWADILINGRNVTVGPDGIPVISDVAGTLTLVTATDDVSSLQFVLADAGANFPAHLGGTEVKITPNNKVLDKIVTIRTGQDLRDAALADGTKVLEGSNVSDEDIDAAVESMAQLADQYENIANNGGAFQSSAHRLPDGDPHSFRPGRVRTGKEVEQTKVITGVRTDKTLAAKSFLDVDCVSGHT